MAENYWTRYMRGRPVTRRRFLRGSALAGGGVAAAAIVGCGDDDDDAITPVPAATGTAVSTPAATPEATATAEPTAPPSGIKRGGALRIGGSVGGDSVFDPAITNHTTTYSLGMGLVYNRLLSYDGDVRVNAELAEALPEQPDDQTYVFKLRPDVNWHDLPPANGRQFTAEDAAFGLNRFNEDNAEFIQGQLDRISNIEVIDDLTFRVTTSEPFAPMIRFLADDPILMVNREQREAVGDAGMKLYENMVGTGPWIRNTFDPGVSARLNRNPNYFEMGEDGQRLPYLDNIEHLAFSPEAQEGAFIAGEFDHFDNIGAGGFFVTVQSLQGQLGDQVAFRKRLHSAIEETHMHTQKAPFDDARVRKAVHLAINRQIALNPFGPESGIYMGPVPQMFQPFAFSEQELLGMPGWREDKEQDIADAVALMNAAGVGVGADETITIGTPIQCDCHAVGIKEDVSVLGLNLELEPLTSPGEYFGERSKGNFIMNIGLEVGGTDADTYLYHRFHTGAPFNRTGFSDPDVDRLLEKQRATLDTEARADAVREASLAIIEHSPQAFTASLVFYPIFRSYVMGHPERIPFGLTHNLARLWMDA